MTQPEAMDWVAKLFEEPLGKLSPDTPRKEIPAWDSLGVLTLMAGLDSDFGITLDDQQLEALKNVNDILDLLKKHAILTEP